MFKKNSGEMKVQRVSVESSLRKVKVNEKRVELLNESESVSSKVIESQALLI